MSTVPAPKPRRYQDFLTPAWHRRFTAAAMLSTIPCYVDALSMADWSSIWSFFPISITGIISVLLLLSALPVFVVRVAANHVGSRTTPSLLESIQKHALKFSNISIFVWYVFAAWWYSEVYRWSAAEEMRLGWTEFGRGRDKTAYRLNERTLFFLFSFVTCGVLQTAWHLAVDMDQTPMPVGLKKQTVAKDDKVSGPLTTTAVPSPFEQLKREIQSIAMVACMKAVTVSMGGFVLYYLVMRRPLWNLAYSFFTSFYALQRPSTPSGISPAATLLAAVFMQSLLLFLTWDFANATYNANVSQEPLKNGKPLTDASKDPNGTLILGLKSKRAFAKASAFRELAIIAARFPSRRATIYAEIDGRAESTWSTILKLCLEEVNGISSRIESTKRKAAPQEAPSDGKEISPDPGLPPLKTDQVFATTPPPATIGGRALRMASTLARDAGQHPGDANTPIKKVTAAGEWTASQAGRQIRKIPFVVDAENRTKALVSTRQQTSGGVNTLLKTPYIGPLFQVTFAKRATATICGTPYSRTILIVCAIQTITNLATLSLKEDRYGRVWNDVPTIIRTFSSTLAAIDAYIESLAPHWTDVSFSDRDRYQVKEVNAVREALKLALRELLGTFGEYSSALGLSDRETRDAKVIAGGQEMRASKDIVES